MEEYSENTTPHEQEFDYEGYRQTKAFATSVDKKLKSQIISQEVARILNEQRFPFAAKIASQGLENAADVFARIKTRKHSYLIENMLPARSYGVISAQYKAGKTWLVCDIIVNAILCGSVLGQLPFRKQLNEETKEFEDIKIVVFIGEGDEFELLSRLDAVAKFYGSSVEEIVNSRRLLMQFSPPDLSSPETIQRIHTAIDEFRPHLTLIDPWYLSAGADADSRNLQSMGLVLRNIQGVCQDVESALLIMQHWNQSGEGKGFGRSTGAGLLEWGRVLGNLSIKSYIGAAPDDPQARTTSRLELEFMGQVSGKYEFVRHIWREDKRDLSSQMYYELENVAVVPEEVEVKNAEQQIEFKILDAIWALVKKHSGEWTKTQIINEATTALKLGRPKIRAIAEYMDAYKLIEEVVLEKENSPTGQKRTVWQHKGDAFVTRMRGELKNGLVHTWTELVISGEYIDKVKERSTIK